MVQPDATDEDERLSVSIVQAHHRLLKLGSFVSGVDAFFELCDLVAA